MNNCITNTKIFKIEKEKIATNSMRNIKLHQKQKLDITNNLNKEKSIEEKIEDLQHIIKNKDNIIKELTKNREIERLNMQNEYVKELQNVREELNNAIDLNVNLQEQFVTYLQNSIQTREMMRAVNRGFFNIHRYTSNILLNNINFIEEVGIRIESNYSLLNILGGGIIAITTAFGLWILIKKINFNRVSSNITTTTPINPTINIREEVSNNDTISLITASVLTGGAATLLLKKLFRV